MSERPVARAYDEDEIAARLSATPVTARALFVCACAERLMATYHWFCDVSGSGSYRTVREALDSAWTVDDVKPKGERDISALVTEDEDDPALGSAVAQNAVACVAYAVGVRENGDVQKAVWAARQLYEAADSVVQQGGAVQTYVEGIQGELPVRLMVDGIYAALSSVESSSQSDLIANARRDGDAFLNLIIGKSDGK
jgi:hypothetical protein